MQEKCIGGVPYEIWPATAEVPLIDQLVQHVVGVEWPKITPVS